MPKSISTALQTGIRSNVTTLAMCLTIKRRDGKPYYLTNHDEDLVIDGNTYDHTIPFTISAISSGSQFAIDNTEVSLFADGTTFTLDHFKDGLFDHAEVEVFVVDYSNVTAGKMRMRRGWFGKFVRNKNKLVKTTVTGMLKVLDFETGRTYQPTCDADFGDARCKVAIRQEQFRSPFNQFGVGDWVFDYDTSLMTQITLTNGDFESDGTRTQVQAITGWTKGDGAAFFVNTIDHIPAGATISAMTAGEGTYSLWGGQDATSGSSGFENVLYRDVDLAGAGISTSDIDAGKISLGLFAMVVQTVYTNDPLKLKIDLTDADGNFISTFDTKWIYLDTFEHWRERALVCPIYPGARTARISIIMRKEDGDYANCGVDKVRLYYWDHTTGTPYDGAIHRCVRVLNFAEGDVFNPPNNSFEANGVVANANHPTISGWTTTGWWRVTNSIGSGGETLGTDDGSYFLAGGDDSTGVQRTNSITQTFALSTVKGLSTARVALGFYVGKVQIDVGFGGPGNSTATVLVEFLNVSNATVASYYLLNDVDFPGHTHAVWETVDKSFVVPATATKVKVTLACKSPTGDSNAKVGFDALKFFFYDCERPLSGDPVLDSPDAATVLDSSVGSYTLDGSLVWKAMTAYTLYDEVAAVTDRKTFTGTSMSGVSGTFETGTIWWISGNNAGLRNVVRVWNSGTTEVKMYFRQPYDIQVGDRFIYVRSCQRRFTEDCVLTFQNGINFRGFPWLPGKLRDATAAENAAG